MIILFFKFGLKKHHLLGTNSSTLYVKSATVKIRNLVKCFVHFLLNFCTLIMCEIRWPWITSTLLNYSDLFNSFLVLSD